MMEKLKKWAHKEVKCVKLSTFTWDEANVCIGSLFYFTWIGLPYEGSNHKLPTDM